jgi:hypothetical protein
MWFYMRALASSLWYNMCNERGYETSGSHLRIMLRRSSLVECVSVLHGTCLQSVEKKIVQQVSRSHVCQKSKYTFYTTKNKLFWNYSV